MKKTFTLLTALFLSAFLFAQSKLSISATGKDDIRVMIDGRKYPANNNMVMLSNLNSGNHSVKIFKGSNDRNRNQFSNRNSRYQLIYSSNVFLKPQYHTDISINRFGKIYVDEQFLTNGYDDADDDWGVDNNDQYYDNYNRKAMDRPAFEQLKQSIARETFDNTKLKIAKQFIAVNYFNTAQVKELVDLFSFENNKLEIAKYAYDYTVDKGNYFLVNDAFSFSNSKEALMDYIKNRT